MQFNDDYPKRRLIENGDYQLMVGRCLQKLVDEKLAELVPAAVHEDEQGRECEATFRHHSGTYLLYARHLDTEQLDVAMPKSDYSPAYEIGLTNELRQEGFEDLIKTRL